MNNSPNNLNMDPSQMTMKEKLKFFEQNSTGKSPPKPISYNMNIFPNKKLESSNSDNLSPKRVPLKAIASKTLASTKGYPKSTSGVASSTNTPATSSKISSTTPSTVHSSSQGIVGFSPSQKSTPNKLLNGNKKLPPVCFKKSLDESLNDTQQKMPDILEVFTDLDLFIEQELNEINTGKRIQAKLSRIQAEKASNTLDVFQKLKNEFMLDKQHYQNEFERQSSRDSKFSTIDEADENEPSMDLTFNSKNAYEREKRVEKLKIEATKQEAILSKINSVVERMFCKVVDESNVALIVSIERHYLVASSRLQAALTEIARLDDPSEPLHSPHSKGKCTIKDIMLEVKPSYLERKNPLHNEFVVVLLKCGAEVYASKPVCITDDVRIVKMPHKFRVPEAYMDFEMRLEVYGTTFWRKNCSIRETMLKKYGFLTFTLAEVGFQRKRYEMIEVIRSEHNPLRKKVLMNVRQKITADVFYDAPLMVKLGDSWYKAQAQLIGHLLEISLADDEEDVLNDPMLFDLHNFDSDFIVPVVSHISKKPFTFLLKFNHCVNGNEFNLLVAAESAEEYSNWVSSINKALVLIK